MPFHLIIKGLSATTDGFGRKPADRFAAGNNTNGIPCNSVSGEREKWVLSIVWRGGAAETYKTELRM